MASKITLAALAMMIVASPAPAAIPVSSGGPAPAGNPATLYCLRVDPITGSRIETIQCRTREDWAGLEVDVDREWAENGIRAVG